MGKPDKPVARKGDYSFRSDVPHEACLALVAKYHYAGGASRLSVVRTIAINKQGEEVGAALWLPPTANAAKVNAKWFLGDPSRHKEVLCLSRLVVRPGEPQNTAGMLLAATTIAVRKDGRYSLALTYADSRMGHTGIVYKACNWIQDTQHVCRPTTSWILDGKQIAQKSTVNRTRAYMESIGATPVSSVKTRFYLVLRP